MTRLLQEPRGNENNIDFRDHYEAPAKQLWLDSARQFLEEELMFPDEVAMPAAYLDHSIGNEDRPHMDDVLSRAASRVFTRGKSSVGAASRHHKVGRRAFCVVQVGGTRRRPSGALT